MIILCKKPNDSGKGKFIGRLKEAGAAIDLKFTHGAKYSHDIELGISKFRFGSKKPRVLRLDGLHYDITNPKHRAKNSAIAAHLKKASGVIFQSNFARDVAKRYLGKIRCKSTVIYNGAPLVKRNPLKDRFVIMTASSWRRHKRLKEMTKAFLAWDKNEHAEFWVAGKADYVVNHPRVKYLGYLSDIKLSIKLQKANVFVHTSYVDACPNSVIEALAHGVPVITSNRGGGAELGTIIINPDPEYNWKKFDPYNPPKMDLEDLIWAYDKAFTFPNGPLGMPWPRQLRKEIDINNIAEKYKKFFQEVLHG